MLYTVWLRKSYIFSYSHYSAESDAQKSLHPPQESHPEVKRSILSQLEKYCENTTLHGLRYVGDTHLTFGERFAIILHNKIKYDFLNF